MFSTSWKTSERKYKVVVERNIKIPVSDGIHLDCDIFRPAGEGKFPAIVGASPYMKEQTEPIKVAAFSAMAPHPGEERARGELESGDPYFYARRGYAHLIINVRGSGLSEGLWEMQGPREVQDVYEAIEWIAKQPWCNGNVGMFGASYFSMIQLMTASTSPPHLKCIFAPWAATDQYRDVWYNGGILVSGFLIQWVGALVHYCDVRPRNVALEELGKEKYEQAIAELKKNKDIMEVKELVDALNNPDRGMHPFMITQMIYSLDGQYWEKRRPKYENIKIPCYLGADWRSSGNHLPAAFRSWEKIKAPKRMVVGPPLYLDRPLYQLQYESLRWFDHWLKGIDTGVMKEPPIKLFLNGTNRWKEADEWPLPETRWTPFYLHENSLLSEHEFWPNEGSDSFFDSPWSRGSVEYLSPPMVEETEIVGPVVADIFASSTDVEVFWSARILEVDEQGKRTHLSTGWLKGSHRALDEKNSKPWLPVHPHDKEEPLEQGKIYDFKIPILPMSRVFGAGTRIAFVISGADYDPGRPTGRTIRRVHPSRITIYRNDDYPSNLILPVTSGNVMGTYISGGKAPTLPASQ